MHRNVLDIKGGILELDVGGSALEHTSLIVEELRKLGVALSVDAVTWSLCG